jgi:hypothetical protein
MRDGVSFETSDGAANGAGGTVETPGKPAPVTDVEKADHGTGNSVTSVQHQARR